MFFFSFSFRLRFSLLMLWHSLYKLFFDFLGRYVAIFPIFSILLHYKQLQDYFAYMNYGKILNLYYWHSQIKFTRMFELFTYEYCIHYQLSNIKWNVKLTTQLALIQTIFCNYFQSKRPAFYFVLLFIDFIWERQACGRTVISICSKSICLITSASVMLKFEHMLWNMHMHAEWSFVFGNCFWFIHNFSCVRCASV